MYVSKNAQVFLYRSLISRKLQKQVGLFLNLCFRQLRQGRTDYAGTHVPMSVPRLGLIKPGQTYVCPKLWAFSIKVTLWLIFHFFENRRLVCPKLRPFAELFFSSRCK